MLPRAPRAGAAAPGRGLARGPRAAGDARPTSTLDAYPRGVRAHVDGEPLLLPGAGAIAVAQSGTLDVLANDQERSGWKLDAFSRHLLALYDYERGIYAVDRPTPRIKARPKLF